MKEKAPPRRRILEPSQRTLVRLGHRPGGEGIDMSRDDMVRHTFVVGATGSGKTELLLGMCANTIAAGSGLVLVDGKGDASTFAKIHALASSLGRAEDVLLLNFSTARAFGSGHQGVRSNTFDPFGTLDETALMAFLVGMMPVSGEAHAFWTDRAVMLLAVLVRIHVHRRDHDGLVLTPSVMRRASTLSAMVDFHEDNTLPASMKADLKAYLDTLPGFDWSKGKKQPSTPNEQHGYLSMQTTRIFDTISGVYGHIFDTGSGDIEMRDVVLNRRILVVLLPALEKGMEETASLGRLVVSTLRDTMTTLMAAPVEADWSAVVSARPAEAHFPFLVVFDELAHYVAPGMSTMTAQARSLGVAMVFATQDVGLLQHANYKEAAGILANTGTKILMKSDSDYVSGPVSLPSGGPGNKLKNMEARSGARLNELSHFLRYPGFVDTGGAVQEMADLLRGIRIAVEEAPYWNLDQIIRSLRQGEFVALQSGDAVSGRAAHVSEGLALGRIRIRQGFAWHEDAGETRKLYGKASRRAAFSADLLGGKGPFAGGRPSFAAVYETMPQDGQSGVEAALAALLFKAPVPEDEFHGMVNVCAP